MLFHWLQMDFFTSNRRASLALREMVDDLMDALLDDRMGVQTEALIHALIHAGLNFLGNVWVGFGKHALIDDLIKDLIDALINFQTDDLMHTLIEALINFRIEASIRVSFNTWISAPIYTFPTLRSMILCVFDQPPKNTLQLFSSAMTSDPGQKQWVDKGRCSVRPQKDQAATTPPPDVWFSASPWVNILIIHIPLL